jgi:hypothetical protein
MPDFRNDLRKHAEAGWAEHTHTKGFTGVLKPDTPTGLRVVHERKPVRSFAPHSRFCLVFFDELQKRRRPRMPSIREELENQSA